MREIDVRLGELRETIEESRTPMQYKSRMAIFNRINQHLEDAGNDRRAFYVNLLRDWPAFVAWELNTPEGVPIFYTPWQLDLYYRSKKYGNIWVCNCRQVGKTIIESTIALERTLMTNNTQVLIVAPTKTQLVARDYFNHYVRTSDFIRNEYLKLNGGGRESKMHIRFGANNSEFMAMNLSGDQKRGESANVIMVDETQLLTKDDYNAVLDPMLSSGFTKKELWRFMTPSYVYREDLGELWENAQESDSTLTMNVHAWRAIDEGIRKPLPKDGDTGSMKERFENLNIDCPFVSSCGVCPGFLPHWFKEYHTEGPDAVPDCRGCFLQNDTFLAEDMGVFPRQSEQYFPAQVLHDIKLEKPLLPLQKISGINDRLVMGIDLGGLTDPTEIVINRWARNNNGNIHMETLARRRMEAVSGDSGGDKPNVDTIVSRIKDTYHHLGRGTKVVPDVTRKDYLASQLTSGKDAIPKNSILTNKAAERNDLRGIWITGEEKARMYQNHRRLLYQGQLKVRGGSQGFWKDYSKQHMGVRVDESSAASYTRFIMPHEDHLVDASVMASALGLEGKTSKSPTAPRLAFLD